MIEKYQEQIATDNKSFHFNLQSNGRLDGSMKFEIKDNFNGGYWLFETIDFYSNFLILGDIMLMKKSDKNKACCNQSEEHFNYHGIKNALCGKIQWSNPFIPIRILVIQMK